MHALKLALIGYGTIAQDVKAGLPDIEGRAIEWAVLLRPGSASARNIPSGVALFFSTHDLLQWQPDLVIEAAGQQAVREQAPRLLAGGVPVVISSAGALADPGTHEAVIRAAHEGRTQATVPSGAVASLDYLGALHGSAQAQVIYESRKPPAAWRQELLDGGHNPDALSEEIVLFNGPANEAAIRYPKNLNVAATLALAGIGMHKTQVRVVVDPAALGNQHSICVQSPLGTLNTTLMNAASPQNPKTSMVVARSVIRSVRRRFSSLLVG